MKVNSIQQNFNLQNKSDSKNNSHSLPSFGLGGFGPIDPPKGGEIGPVCFVGGLFVVGLSVGLRKLGKVVDAPNMVNVANKIDKTADKLFEDGWLHF